MNNTITAKALVILTRLINAAALSTLAEMENGSCDEPGFVIYLDHGRIATLVGSYACQNSNIDPRYIIAESSHFGVGATMDTTARQDLITLTHFGEVLAFLDSGEIGTGMLGYRAITTLF